MRPAYSALLMTVALPGPALAQAVPATPAVAAALRAPRLVGASAARDRIDAAIVAGDSDAFIAEFAPDAVVNSPLNRVNDRAAAERLSRSGTLHYKYLRRSIEYAAPRGTDEAVFMGEETYEPPAGAPLAGKTVHRRFTDIWQRINGAWKLSLRQATVYKVE